MESLDIGTNNVSFIFRSTTFISRTKWRSLSEVLCYIRELVAHFTHGNAAKHDKYHYDDVTMSFMASQITSLTIVYSTVYSDADQRKHQSSASLAFVRGIHRGPVNSPHKWPVTRKMFPFDDVIMCWEETRFPTMLCLAWVCFAETRSR